MTEILVLDDKEYFVKSIIARLKRGGVEAMGYSSVEAFGRDARSGRLQDVKLMFFDMNLEPRGDGRIFTAADVILVARTYAPAAKILIFTHEDIAVEDCIRCVQLGALGLIPKSEDDEQLLLAARVYPHIGDEQHAIEAVIRELWAQLQGADVRDKGQLLEMLTANLLSSIDGLTLVDNNQYGARGEVDLIFQNDLPQSFWNELGSFHILVECKNRKDPPERSDFNNLAAKVKAHGHCGVGIMVSWEKVSSGFKELQRTPSEGERIFSIDRPNLAALVSRPYADREMHLRALFSKQL